MTSETVSSLAELVGGEVRGDGRVAIRGVGDLRAARKDQICFVRGVRYADAAGKSGAGALIVPEPLEVPLPQIVVGDVQLAFARIALRFHPVPRATVQRVHATAVVDPSAVLEQPVELGPHVVVGARARIGAGSIVHAGSVIGEDCALGRDCVVYPRVVVYHGVTIGARAIVHSGSVIGADGFGYAQDAGVGRGSPWVKIPQIGGVEIGDDVEIGANSTIDRGTMGMTRIGSGTKIDNVVHIGHNCTIGRDCAIAGFSALSGSTVFGDRVTCAGHVVSAGHLKVCDDVRIGGNSVLREDIKEPGDFMGYPVQSRVRWGRTIHILDHLVELKERVRELEKR